MSTNVNSVTPGNLPRLEIPLALRLQGLVTKAIGVAIPIFLMLTQLEFSKNFPIIASVKLDLLGLVLLSLLAWAILKFGGPSKETMEREQALCDFINGGKDAPVLEKTAAVLCQNPKLMERAIGHAKKRGSLPAYLDRLVHVRVDGANGHPSFPQFSLLYFACSRLGAVETVIHLLENGCKITSEVVAAVGLVNPEKSEKVFRWMVDHPERVADLDNYHKAIIFVGANRVF